MLSEACLSELELVRDVLDLQSLIVPCPFVPLKRHPLMFQIPLALQYASAYGFRSVRRSSSVAERALGKGEVGSSILPCGTSFCLLYVQIGLRDATASAPFRLASKHLIEPDVGNLIATPKFRSPIPNEQHSHPERWQPSRPLQTHRFSKCE